MSDRLLPTGLDMYRTIVQPNPTDTPQERSRKAGSPVLPLRDTARKLRRNVLLLSGALGLFGSGILAIQGETLFGIEMRPGGQATLETVMLGLLAFFMVSFLCYSFIDLISWDRRGAPRGFTALLVSPLALALEIGMPLAAAAAALVLVRPGLVEHVPVEAVSNLQAKVLDLRSDMSGAPAADESADLMLAAEAPEDSAEGAAEEATEEPAERAAMPATEPAVDVAESVLDPASEVAEAAAEALEETTEDAMPKAAAEEATVEAAPEPVARGTEEAMD